MPTQLYSVELLLARVAIGANTWVMEDMKPKTRKYKKIKQDFLDIQYNNGTGI